jgi:hypothetical protein
LSGTKIGNGGTLAAGWKDASKHPMPVSTVERPVSARMDKLRGHRTVGLTHHPDGFVGNNWLPSTGLSRTCIPVSLQLGAPIPIFPRCMNDQRRKIGSGIQTSANGQVFARPFALWLRLSGTNVSAFRYP